VKIKGDPKRKEKGFNKVVGKVKEVEGKFEKIVQDISKYWVFYIF